MRELYIYYKIAVADQAVAIKAVTSAQASLTRRFPDLTARLLCRSGDEALGDSTGARTWMEIYAHPGNGIDACLAAQINAAIEPACRFMVGERHTEEFTSCA